MNNIGNYEFTEKSREYLLRLAELTNQDERFVKDALRYICLKSFNDILKIADKQIMEDLKKHADNAELFQSYFRSKIPEVKVREAYTNVHNNYVDGFITECGASYSAEIVEQIKTFKF